MNLSVDLLLLFKSSNYYKLMKQANNCCWGASDRKCSKPLPEPHLHGKKLRESVDLRRVYITSRGNELADTRHSLLKPAPTERERECVAVV